MKMRLYYLTYYHSSVKDSSCPFKILGQHHSWASLKSHAEKHSPKNTLLLSLDKYFTILARIQSQMRISNTDC
jgi:hypothetical protein